MSTSLALTVDSSLEGRRRAGDPVMKNDQVLICSSIAQRGARDHDRNQSQNLTWNGLRMS